MAATATTVDSGQTQVIKVQGRFDFSLHLEFRSAYEQAPASVKRYVVDLTDASYIDSSALGMLLLLRDYAGGEKAKISIEGANPDVKKILMISNFNQLFLIE